MAGRHSGYSVETMRSLLPKRASPTPVPFPTFRAKISQEVSHGHTRRRHDHPDAGASETARMLLEESFICR